MRAGEGGEEARPLCCRLPSSLSLARPAALPSPLLQAWIRGFSLLHGVLEECVAFSAAVAGVESSRHGAAITVIFGAAVR